MTLFSWFPSKSTIPKGTKLSLITFILISKSGFSFSGTGIPLVLIFSITLICPESMNSIFPVSMGALGGGILPVTIKVDFLIKALLS